LHLSAILVTGDGFATATGKPDGGPPRRSPAPLVCAEVFGQSVLERTVAGLRNAGVRMISLVTGPGDLAPSIHSHVKVTSVEKSADRWTAAESIFRMHVQQKVTTVLVAELGAYVELDVADAVGFHTAHHQPVTPLHDQNGPLRNWILDTAPFFTSGFCTPAEGEAVSTAVVPYRVTDYVNRLASPHDFRRLVMDSFTGRCSIKPSGREVKPGVWLDSGARLHRTARLVAPAYVGCDARVRAGAVITRFSNLERYATVGEGSVVASASVLPNTVIGSGLDVCEALVSGGELFDLRRNVLLSIRDRSLISDGLRSPAQKTDRPRHHARPEQPVPELNFQYAQYVSRAAGRLLEVFRGEV